jgi:hypothetical protein
LSIIIRVNLNISIVPLLLVPLIIPTIAVLGQEQEQFLTYQNLDYGIRIQYPTSWEVHEGDIEPGDYATDIVTFVPEGEGDSNTFESADEFGEDLDYRFYVGIDNYPLDSDNLDLYLDDIVNVYDEDLDSFKVIEYNTQGTLGGQGAYQLVYQQENDNTEYKHLETGTIIDKSKVYFINFKSKVKDYETFLPVVQKMIDSFQIMK